MWLPTLAKLCCWSISAESGINVPHLVVQPHILTTCRYLCSSLNWNTNQYVTPNFCLTKLFCFIFATYLTSYILHILWYFKTNASIVLLPNYCLPIFANFKPHVYSNTSSNFNVQSINQRNFNFICFWSPTVLLLVH